ncbi:hypothetical protein EN844_06545 [Mesorhizobium sp. M3A.F.Ca.ET.201.01.1.1]|uniref:hypothetical protein n=1 Tax=Mesorhizobium sp. M3A.F.Ca.ET.201.01.1.1 TaxID=2563946 RepID=UPI00109389E8|nr:hypothetical protein [Mesorhizobium sp. M3A.F.Ca.ET.201.01.1.1]TGS70395.1 hypothetical protein EN844_06545 [Mesorhizobium sp. M3A.F.Ca.ET.201.01.1.1]
MTDNIPELDERALEDDPIAEYDRLARAQMTPKQLSDMEEMPNRVTYLSDDQLKEIAIDARRTFDEVKAIAMETIENGVETDLQAQLLRRSMLAEYIWRRTCLILADEFQRRRTGVAPRTRSMN